MMSDDTPRADTMPLAALDPHDLHSLLLRADELPPNATTDSSAEPDWASLSAALWAAEHGLEGKANMNNAPATTTDFSNGFDGLDLSFDFGLSGDPMAMSVDPAQLHQYSSLADNFSMPSVPMIFDNSNPYAYSALAPAFSLSQVQQQQQGGLATPQTHGRRLSVTSSSESSSSGASLSPVMDPASITASPQAPAPAATQATTSLPAGQTASPEDFAAFIRTLAANPGLLSADPSALAQKLPLWSNLSTAAPAAPGTHLTSGSATTLSSSPGTSVSASISSRSTTSSPPPGLLPSALGGASTSTTAPAAAVRPARPKTDHTTIERRYRTNLNARITALKKAVPALRVLEPTLSFPGDNAAIDERGFIDGVRVARKVSKGNVLGKAVEYIKVLKKRETRLAKEYAGLKALLISALPGGTHILNAWEHEWRSQHGGPERDEVDGDASDEGDGEGEGDDDDDEEEGQRPKKRARPAASTSAKAKAGSATTANDENATERKKRGRPRKNPLPPASSATSPTTGEATSAASIPQPAAQGPPQYLLAAFAFFSFMHPLSPGSGSGSSASHPHTHTGHVLGFAPPSAPVQSGVSLGQVVQVFHLLVSAAVFASIVLPWLPRLRSRARHMISRVSSSGPSRGRLLTPHSSRPATPSLSPSSSSLGSSDEDSPTRDGTVYGRWAVLKSVISTSRGAPDEAQQLRSALGIHSGVLGLAFQTLQPPRPSRARSLHARSLEQRAYVRLGELAALSGSMAERAHLFAAMRTHTDAFRASARDLATLALLVRPWSSTRGKALWDQARSAGEERTRACEAVALEMEVEEAASVLKGMSGVRESGKAPLTALGEYLVAERITGVAARMFVAAVNGVQEEEEREDRMGLIRAGEDASGSVRALAGRFRAILSGASGSLDDENAMDAASEEDDGHALLRALGLFRSVFGGQGQTPKIRLALRAALGARAFERRDVEGLEDARDRAVDMVVDCERAARRA